ncbi:hypothetical protein [Nisaea sp.]|uniref:hypothetical protein n=1 Tax=Nisaea sp. TaxID=2024842 RepID=UPI002B27052C|nr:hypothetical protein [Nisaea sp.]
MANTVRTEICQTEGQADKRKAYLSALGWSVHGPYENCLVIAATVNNDDTPPDAPERDVGEGWVIMATKPH